MTERKTRLTVLTAGLALLGLSVPLAGQTTLEGKTAFQNLGASQGRPPGDMVATGFARAQQAADAAWQQVLAPQITETSRPTSIRAQTLAKAIEVVFDQLESTILFLGNRWLARAGLAPLLPPEFFFPTADGGDGSDTTDSTSDGDTSDSTDSTDGGGGRDTSRGGRG